MTQPETRTIEILKPGTFTDVNGASYTFSAADVAELVESYDPVGDPAPAVIGHPKTDDPAYAWAKGLSIVGDRAVAELGEIDVDFGRVVTAGRYKKISPSIYPRDHASNPTPGKLYLKHIGFLGAKAPAIKGLATVQFSEELQADCITPEIEIHEINLSEPGDTGADNQLEQVMTTPKKEDPAIELAERETALTTREAELATRETAVATREEQVEQADRATVEAASMNFAEGLVDKMILPPAQKDRVAFLLTTLATQGEDIMSFGEGDAAERPHEALKKLLGEAKPVLSFSEVSKPEDKTTIIMNFASPDGHAVDPAALEIHNKAVALQNENKELSYIDAVKRATAA